jgi:signal transduction histidine kinase
MLVADMLGEPGILAEPFKHYARDLKLLTGTLTTLVERMSQTQAGAEPVFVREPLRPPLPSNAARTAEWMRKSTDGEAEAAGDAGLMVKSCERLLAAVAGPRVSLQISFERSIGRLTLKGDELTRVLLNLVKNASESMPSGGRVAITVRRALGPGPAALISVQDNGTGISAHAMGQIFQAGFTSKPAERKWPAMAHHGLGLTIVRDLVEGAGGSVRVMSALRKGTTFELRVPCHRQA